MSPKTEESKEKSEEITKLLLLGTVFTGFTFHTSFTLSFNRNEYRTSQGYSLPDFIELHLLNNWWFYSKDEWDSKLKEFPYCESIDPEEPVQAFELANLRWINDSIVSNVCFTKEGLCVAFKNGKSLTVSSKAIEGYSWMINEFEVDEINTQWSVVCEDESYYVRTP
jgi:hypothetical protein